MGRVRVTVMALAVLSVLEDGATAGNFTDMSPAVERRALAVGEASVQKTVATQVPDFNGQGLTTVSYIHAASVWCGRWLNGGV
jgi:hypothetical protein